MLTLYDYYRSSASFRVRIALNLKNLEYHAVPIHLLAHGGEQYTESYRRINPQSLVPTLQDGTLTITQSLAIIEYLDEVYPSTPLLPSNPSEKALVRAFALSIACDIHPLNNLRVLNYLTGTLHISEDNKNAWYQYWITKGLTALEKSLAKHGQHRFCFGDQPSLADVCLVPQLFNARRFGCDLAPYPTLVRIDAQCQSMTAFSHAFPKEPVS